MRNDLRPRMCNISYFHKIENSHYTNEVTAFLGTLIRQ